MTTPSIQPARAKRSVMGLKIIRRELGPRLWNLESHLLWKLALSTAPARLPPAGVAFERADQPATRFQLSDHFRMNQLRSHVAAFSLPPATGVNTCESPPALPGWF